MTIYKIVNIDGVSSKVREVSRNFVVLLNFANFDEEVFENQIVIDDDHVVYV